MDLGRHPPRMMGGLSCRCRGHGSWASRSQPLRRSPMWSDYVNFLVQQICASYGASSLLRSPGRLEAGAPSRGRNPRNSYCRPDARSRAAAFRAWTDVNGKRQCKNMIYAALASVRPRWHGLMIHDFFALCKEVGRQLRADKRVSSQGKALAQLPMRVTGQGTKRGHARTP